MEKRRNVLLFGVVYVVFVVWFSVAYVQAEPTVPLIRLSSHSK